MEEEDRKPLTKLDYVRQLRQDELHRLEQSLDPFPRELLERPWTGYDMAVVMDEVFARLEKGMSMQLICSDPNMPAYATVMSWMAKDDDYEKRYENLKPARARALFELAMWEIQRARDPEAMKVAEKRANVYLRAAALLSPAQYSDKTHTQLGKGQGTAQAVQITLNIGSNEVQKGAITTIDSELP